MPRKEVNGAKIHYDVSGEGIETIVFAHGLLWNRHVFDEQIASLKGSYRCVTFDFRGHGQSEATESGYDIDALTDDIRALIVSLGCTPCHFVGHSMGGFIGMRLAIRHPEHIKSLILIGTTADPEPMENLGPYKRLNFIARWFGLRLIAPKVMAIMFGQKFLLDPDRTQLKEKWRQYLIANNRISISRAVNGVISRQGVYGLLDQISAPTLILVGDFDTATVPAKSERMQQRIKGSHLILIPGAGHTATVEEPVHVNTALLAFLEKLK